MISPPEFAGGSAKFSPGILVDGTLYVSGQVGQDLKTQQIPADFETEVKTLLNNIGLVLKAAGMTSRMSCRSRSTSPTWTCSRE